MPVPSSTAAANFTIFCSVLNLVSVASLFTARRALGRKLSASPLAALNPQLLRPEIERQPVDLADELERTIVAMFDLTPSLYPDFTQETAHPGITRTRPTRPPILGDLLRRLQGSQTAHG
jgi:hypothetical protein